MLIAMRELGLVVAILVSGCAETDDSATSDHNTGDLALFKCGWGVTTQAMHPDVQTVADDTVTMTSESWSALNETALDVTEYMRCRELARCGEIPAMPAPAGRPIEHDGLVTISYRDWQAKQTWATLAERWLECAG